jgi:hypothetical protein
VVAASRSGPRNGPIESLRSSTSATFERQFVAAEERDFLRGAIFADLEIPCFKSPMISPDLVFTVASSITRFEVT